MRKKLKFQMIKLGFYRVQTINHKLSWITLERSLMP